MQQSVANGHIYRENVYLMVVTPEGKPSGN